MSAHRIYASIAAITAELARTGIPKAHFNSEDGYAYRGIDDLCHHLAPLLVRHKLCVLPRVLERKIREHVGSGAPLSLTSLKVAFDLVSARDSSSHTIEVHGEALDEADKGTAKAMTAAYKQAMLLTFCVPTRGVEDADASTPKSNPSRSIPDPDQGWDQWSADIKDLIRVCETEEALARIQSTYSALLRASSKRRPDVFSAIGVAFQSRRGIITSPIAHPNTDARDGNEVTANG